MDIRIKALDCLNNELLNNIVAHHTNYFQHGLSTSLGKNYLKYFYKRIATTSDSVFLGCFDKNETLCGFVCGTINSNKFYDFGHCKMILLHSFFSLLRFDLSIVNFIRGIIKTIKFRNYKINGELLSLIVYPGIRRKGIGRELVLALCNFFNMHNIDVWKVSTDGDLGSNFYSKLGMDKIKEFNFVGIKSCFFVGQTKQYLLKN